MLEEDRGSEQRELRERGRRSDKNHPAWKNANPSDEPSRSPKQQVQHAEQNLPVLAYLHSVSVQATNFFVRIQQSQITLERLDQLLMQLIRMATMAAIVCKKINSFHFFQSNYNACCCLC